MGALGLGEPGELLDRLGDLAGAGVEVAQRVGGAQVRGLLIQEGAVLDDGQVQLALAHVFVGPSDDGGAVYGHVVTGRADRLLPPHMSVIQSYQSVPLLNRRCPDLQTEAH